MRKFHSLLTGLIFTLFATTSYALPVTPDVAGFTASINDSAKLVLFTNTSTIGSEPGERHAVWSFGDGTTASTPPLANTYHHYQSPGVYNVCLSIYRRTTSGDTVLSSVYCHSVTIERICRADFEKIPYPSAGTNLTVFRALPWTNNNARPTRICWQFGDGHDTCINYTSSYTGQLLVGHNYSTPGQYQVCVNILYDGGCHADKCHMVQIGRPDTCGADFEKINTSATSLSVYYKALPSHNNNRKPSSVCWRFGDGTPDTCINYSETYTGLYAVNHHYNHGGNYEVCVRITYYGGCLAYKCRNIVVALPDSCAANFERIQSPTALPLLAYYRALPYNSNNRKPSRICWQFGDGHDTCINYVESYTGSYVVAHTYSHSGTYNVCVNILYFGGCQAQLCRPVVIPPTPTGCSVNLVQVIPSSISLLRGFIATPHSYAVPPSPVAYLCWRFGDGSPDTCIVADSTHPVTNYGINHTFPHAGVYNTCVRVVFRNGCVAEECKEVRILAGAGNPRLTLSPNPTHGDLNVEFLSFRTEQVQVRIISNTGIPLRTYTRNVVQGLNNWGEGVSTLPPGIYNYVVQSPYQFVSQSFIKL